MEKRYGALLTILVALALIVVVAAGVSVSTDKSVYTPGSVVTIRGTAPAGQSCAIQVKDPVGATVWLDQKTAGSDGSFTSSFRLKKDARTGTYKVYVSCAAGKASTTFRVKKPAAPAPTPAAPAPAPGVNYCTLASEYINSSKRIAGFISELISLLEGKVDTSEWKSRLSSLQDEIKQAEALLAQGKCWDAYKKASDANKKLVALWKSVKGGGLEFYGGRAKEFGVSEEEALRKLGKMLGFLVRLGEICDLGYNDTLTLFRLMGSISESAEKIKELRGEIESLKSRIEELEKKKAELEAKLGEASPKIKELEEEINRLKGELSAKEQELAEYEGRVKKLQSAVEEANKNAEAWRSELESVRRALEEEKAAGMRNAVIALIVGLVVGAAVVYFIRRQAAPAGTAKK